MTNLEWLKETESEILFHLDRYRMSLERRKKELEIVRELIAKEEGQPEGTDCPTDQSCDR